MTCDKRKHICLLKTNNVCYSNKVITKIFYGTSSYYICSTTIFVLGSPPYFSCYFFPRGAPPPPPPCLSRLWSSLLLKKHAILCPISNSIWNAWIRVNCVFGWINYIFSFDNYYNHLLSGHSGKSCCYNYSSWLSLTLHIDRAPFFDFDKTYLCIL